MAKLPFPDVPSGPLRELLEELHKLHARAGWPSVRQLAAGQNFSHTAVHELFTKPTGDRKLPVLLNVVEKLASLAPRVDSEATLDKFDQLWATAAGRMDVKKQSAPLVSHIEDNEMEQYKIGAEEFVAEFKRIVEEYGKLLDPLEIGRRARVRGEMISDIFSGKLVPEAGTVHRILSSANVPNSDIERMLAYVAQLEDWRRSLDARRSGA